MYARNKTGPRTVPCGTPLVTGLGVEDPQLGSTDFSLSFFLSSNTGSTSYGRLVRGVRSYCKLIIAQRKNTIYK